MKFGEMRSLMQNHFKEMSKSADSLFEVEVDKEELWNLYLDSFPADKNKIFRERREHDCSCCRHFVKTIGNAVFIKNNEVHTIWGFNTDDDTYQPVLTALDAFVKSKVVTDVYVTKDKRIGTEQNYEEVENGNIITWEHFYLELPTKFVDRGNQSIGEVKGSLRATKNVFKRSLDEITEDAVETVLELINSNTLYRGAEWKSALDSFLTYKKEYVSLRESEKDNYAWEKSRIVGVAIGRIRNHSIGTLLVDISEGVDLDTAVRKYEAIVAPSNYKRPKAIFTKRMVEDAQKTITELGYMESLGRRFATLDDITVNNILFSNRDAAKRITGARDVFGEMANSCGANNAKKFSKVEEISAEKFVNDVLPTAKEVEVFLENRHTPNFVSLIAPKDKSSKSMFKWNNGFSWAYSGNITDSDIRENVKKAGGSVTGELRFSIQWNDGANHDGSDYDAHCKSPIDHIYFSHNRSADGGNLDVDIITPRGVAVENITWANRRHMTPGEYNFYVNCYTACGSRGFKAEIEFDGQIYSFEYPHTLRTGSNVQVATVTLDRNGKFTIKENLKSTQSNKEVWGLTTNNFVPVSVVMYSPNYWDEQDGIGNRHYMFMLKDCVNPETPNGFYNEFLKNELDKHKRVFEALGGKMAVEYVDDQLSGIGFSATKRNDIVVKVKGATERIMRVKF